MLSGLRGLAQSAVRGLVALATRAEVAYREIRAWGLGYPAAEFYVDYESYAQQDYLTTEVERLDRQQLIPGTLHGESLLNLTCKFKYDVKAVYEDLKGNIVERHWSVIDNKRLSQQEIMDQAAMFAEDYAPEEFPYHAEPELVGLWVRAGAFG